MTAVNGFYINLDRSPERRAHMEEQARKAGLDWLMRFPAVDGRTLQPGPKCKLSPGGLACFQSHLAAIESAPADSYTFIFEDDVEISADLAQVLHPGQLPGLGGYDLVLLDCQPDLSSQTLGRLWRSLSRQVADPRDLADCGAARRILGVDMHDAEPMYCWGMSSYLVTPKGHRTLPPLMRECLANGPPGQWDIHVRNLLRARRLSAVVLAPFLATPLLESYEGTTIDAREMSAENLALSSAARRMFFAGPVAGIEEHARPLLEGPAGANPQLRLLSLIMAQAFVRGGDEGLLAVG